MTLEGQAPAPVPEVPRPRWQLAAIPIVLCAGLLIASFLKLDLTHNDFERFDNLRLTFLFFGLIATACGAYAVLWRERPALSAVIVLSGAVVGGALLLASFPVGSKDAFLYAFFGKVWGTYHTNPYTTPPSAFVADPWQPFAQVIWAKEPAPYGPLFLWQTRLVDALAAGRLFVAVWAHKVIATAALAGAIAIGARLMSTAANERWYRIALLAWNPLLLFESASNGHNDAVMVLLLLGAVWSHRRGGLGRRLLAPALLACGIWYKWYAVLYVPAFMVAVGCDAGRKELRRWVIIMVVAVLASGVVLLAPLAEALPLVAHRLVAHENLREVFPLQLSPLLAALLWGIEKTGQVGGRWPLMWFDVIRLGLFALVTLVALICQWRGKIGLIESLCGLSVAFTLLLVTILWPWHLEVPVALALIAAAPAWSGLGVLLTLMALLSYFFTFVWATVLLVVLTIALWIVRRFRRVEQ
jgi:hypothetical protein